MFSCEYPGCWAGGSGVGTGMKGEKCFVMGFCFPLGELFPMAFALGCLEKSEC